MATKQVEIEGIGTVTLYKRRGLTSMRLSIASDGGVRLTMPYHVPYQAALAFARSKRDWLAQHKPPETSGLQNAQPIGKGHVLRFVINFKIDKPQTRVTGTEVLVNYPATLDVSGPAVQKAAAAAGVRALRSEAEGALPMRLAELARRHGFTYRSVTVKKLKGRWGSCDQDRNIVLNLYLMQLPWELIDYVLLHELIHTRHLNHGEAFWADFTACEPRAKQLRRQVRSYQPNFVLPQA